VVSSRAGLSVFVIVFHMNSRVQYEVPVIWILHLNFMCLYLNAFVNHMH